MPTLTEPGSQQHGRPAPTPQLLDTGVVAILRARTAVRVVDAAVALADAGVTCLEVTLTVPGALDTLATLNGQLSDGVALGVGTVTTEQQAIEALDAGARFLVSPATCPEVLAVAACRGVPCYPGAWTPTEVLDAWRGGAAAVKLFPAASGGPGHLRRILDPLPHVPLVPTGGIDIADAAAYIRAGAVAVGVGSPLLGDALTGGDLGELRERAVRLLGEVAAAREER